MKPSHLVPAATALIGFALAWIVKPGGTTVSVTAPPKTEEAALVRPTRNETAPRDSASTGKRPVEVKAGDFPLADRAEKGPKTGDEAKMNRLTEALGLSIDQQGSIIQLVEDSQKTMNMDLSAIEDLTARGNAIEEGLKKILTPEQFAKFQEVQDRERDNRIDHRAQRQLSEAVEFIDLSPGQREELKSRLVQKSKADLQSIPAAASLLFSKSVLPTGGKEMTVDGVLVLQKMGEKVTTDDPEKNLENLMNGQKQEMEETLRCFDGILTPAQMGQYQAFLIERRETMKRIRERAAEQQPIAQRSLLEPPQQEPPLPAPVVEPDTDEDE